MSQQDLEYSRSLLSWVDSYIKQPQTHGHSKPDPNMVNWCIQIANTWAFIASCDKGSPWGSV